MRKEEAEAELAPARPDPHLPDAVWMRPSHVRLFEHPWDPEGRGSWPRR